MGSKVSCCCCFCCSSWSDTASTLGGTAEFVLVLSSEVEVAAYDDCTPFCIGFILSIMSVPAAAPAAMALADICCSVITLLLGVLFWPDE
jgi:hypothetical protein